MHDADSDARCRTARILLACRLGLAAAALSLAAGAGAPASAAGALAGRSTRYPSGGGGLAPVAAPKRKLPRPPSKHSHGRWLGGFTITEYWPAPESWFLGRMVNAPGLTGKYPIDWLYSATGVSMNGEGIGLNGRIYHIDSLGDGGWMTAGGQPTSPLDGWADGPPYWRAGGYWRTRAGAVTFPLAAGGWSAGPGQKYVPLRGVSFAAGPSLPLRYYQSIAVDPSVIPLGSRVYIPAYRHDRYGGWFIAQDTGGAISGRHIDLYRSPPALPTEGGQHLTGRRIMVIKPHR